METGSYEKRKQTRFLRLHNIARSNTSVSWKRFMSGLLDPSVFLAGFQASVCDQ